MECDADSGGDCLAAEEASCSWSRSLERPVYFAEQRKKSHLITHNNCCACLWLRLVLYAGCACFFLRPTLPSLREAHVCLHSEDWCELIYSPVSNKSLFAPRHGKRFVCGSGNYFRLHSLCSGDGEERTMASADAWNESSWPAVCVGSPFFLLPPKMMVIMGLL